MAGASFSTGFNALAGVPKPTAKPKTTGASLTGLAAPGQGSGFSGLAPAPKPTTPVAPQQATPPKASATSTAAPSSPLDSTYYENLAANQLKVNNSINSLNATSQNDNTNLQSALAQLAYQQPRDQLATEEAANRRGALYSSVEGQQQGDLLNKYQTKRSTDTTANAQRQAAIASQIQGLQSGEKLYETGQYDAAVARAVKAALSNPATGQAPVAAAAAPAPLAPAPPSQAAQLATLAKTVAKAKAAGVKHGVAGAFTQTSARAR